MKPIAILAIVILLLHSSCKKNNTVEPVKPNTADSVKTDPVKKDSVRNPVSYKTYADTFRGAIYESEENGRLTYKGDFYFYLQHFFDVFEVVEISSNYVTVPSVFGDIYEMFRTDSSNNYLLSSSGETSVNVRITKDSLLYNEDVVLCPDDFYRNFAGKKINK